MGEAGRGEGGREGRAITEAMGFVTGDGRDVSVISDGYPDRIEVYVYGTPRTYVQRATYRLELRHRTSTSTEVVCSRCGYVVDVLGLFDEEDLEGVPAHRYCPCCGAVWDATDPLRDKVGSPRYARRP